MTSPFWSKNSGSRPERNLRQQADAARDAGQWPLAVQLFERAANTHPKDATALWIQAGNCAKEAHQFSRSLDFYERAKKSLLTVLSGKRDEAWSATMGDLFVQIGHLFKVSGNFCAARNAYHSAAALGDQNGRSELGEYARVSPDIAWSPNPLQGSGPPAAAFRSVANCELHPLDPTFLRAASKTLMEWGDAHELARAFAELAFLCDPASDAVEHHQAFIAQTPLAPLPPIAAPRTVIVHTARAKLRTLASELRNLTEEVRSSLMTAEAGDLKTDDEKQPAEPYSPLGLPLANDTARKLAAGIAMAHAAVWHRTSDFAQLFGDAVERCLVDVRPAGSLVTFPEIRTPETLRVFATRVLNEAVNAWLSDISIVRRQGKCDPVQIAVRFNYGDALRMRRRELGGATALYAELETMLFAAIDDPDSRDLAMAALVRGDPEKLSATEARDMLNKLYVGPHLTRSLLAIAFRNAVEPREIVDYAQALKDRDLLKDAAEVLAQLDETLVPDNLLIEKALVSKAVGDFSQAARILERCYKNNPTTFLRNELAMVLPEVEPIDSILQRYASDPVFFEAIHSHAAFSVARNRRATISREISVQPAPELLPTTLTSDQSAMLDIDLIEVLGLGVSGHSTPNGGLPILRPVDFVRARISSREPVQRLRVRIDGKTVAECGGSLLTHGYESSPHIHQVFNAWFETGRLEPGAHALQLYFEEARGGYRTHDRTVWIDSRDWPALAALSPSIIASSPPGEGSIYARVEGLPTERFDAQRSYFNGELKRILVMRADQLGDTVLSLSAVDALRRHFPEAQVDALVSSGQADLARASELFDDVFSIDFPYDPIARRRLLGFEGQKQLSAQLADRRYDLAIDLSPGDQTRPLLKLVGARYTAGFKPERFPWLDVALDLRTRDPGNRQEGMPHARAPLALIEAVVVAALRRSMTLSKAPLDPAYRRGLGLGEDERYAVFHSGARTASRKWPLARYLDVARGTIDRYGLRVVLMLDDPAELPDVPADLAQGLIVLRDKPSFAQFDGLLSNCAIFLGNDTGPKHLATLRGAPVVSIHMGAVNWNEWAQDGSGLVLTRRVPCYGCGIEFAEECGRNLPCLLDITVNDAVHAIATLLSQQGYNT